MALFDSDRAQRRVWTRRRGAFPQGDGDELGFPLEGFLTEFPSESFEAGAAGKVKDALNGGNGRSWIDKACSRRCGIDGAAGEEKKPAAAAGASEKKKP